MLNEFVHKRNTVDIISYVFELKIEHRPIIQTYIRLQNRYFWKNRGLFIVTNSREFEQFKKTVATQLKSLSSP